MPRIPPPKIPSPQVWEAVQACSAIRGPGFAAFVGDASRCLRGLPDSCINTCVTSPPYWGARDYEHQLQIGLEESVEDYVKKLVSVFREVRRVLADDGTVWLNLGDCYCHGESAARPGNGCASWARNKQLALAPFRVAMALQEDGWLLRNTVVWHKPNAMPASVRDRLASTWEPFFLLAKAEQYYFNLDAIRIPHKTDDNVERRRAENGSANGKAKGKEHLRQWLNSPRHRSTIEGLREIRRRPNAPDPTELAAYFRRAADEKGVSIGWVADKLKQPFERVRHYFRTDRIGSRLPPEETWEALKDLLDLGTEFDDAMSVEVGDNVFRNHPKGRNPGDLASFSIKGNAEGHFAMMPLSLARWALTATLPANGVCLDPFMGVGTTGLAALELGGRFVGVDLREDFIQVFCDSLAESQTRMNGSVNVQDRGSLQRPMKLKRSATSSPLVVPTSLQIASE